MQSLPLRPCRSASFMCANATCENSLALAQHVSTGQVAVRALKAVKILGESTPTRPPVDPGQENSGHRGAHRRAPIDAAG
jgi:hypothetical protein